MRQRTVFLVAAALALSTAIGLLAVAVAAAAAAGTDARAGRPNVLILFADDQRADTIAALGNPTIRTPNLDRIAGQGTAFTRAYCMGSLQGAVCVPSRAMLLTGRTLFRADEKLDGQPTWPEAFAARGYSTFLTGKWHNGKESLRKTFKEAEAVFFGGMGDPYALPLVDLGPGGTLVNERVSGEHSVKLFADAASRFLEAHGGKNSPPFLCYVAFNFPHDPRTAPAEYRARYRDDAMPLVQQSPHDMSPHIARRTGHKYRLLLHWHDILPCITLRAIACHRLRRPYRPGQ